MLNLLKSTKNMYSALFLVLILSFFLNTYGIWWGVQSFSGLPGWASDEIIPSNVLSGMAAFFSNGWHDKYPPFHYYVLAILYSPFVILHKLKMIDLYSNPIYKMLFYIGKSISVLMGTATVFVVYLCGREIYDKKASVFAALITALICPFIYYSKTINLDVPYIFWFVLSLLFYIRILKNQRIADYLLFSMTAVISICTKDQAYGFYILTPIFIVLSHYLYRRKENKNTRIIDSLVDRKIVFSFLLGVTLFLVLHNILFNMDGFIKHIKLITGPDLMAFQEFENNILGHLMMFYKSLQNLRFSFGWPIFFVCLLGLFCAFLQRKQNHLLFWVMIPGLSYYLFLMSAVLWNYDRFVMPLCIILAFFGGKFLSDFLNPNQRFYKGRIVLVSAIFVYTFAYSFSVDVLMARDSRFYVEKWMKQNIHGNSLVVSVSYFVGFLPRLQNFNWKHIGPSSVDMLAQIKPDYIIISSIDNFGGNGYKKTMPQMYKFYSKLKDEKLEYNLLLKYRSSPKWNLLNYEGASTNINKINPEIQIFKKKY